MEQVREEMQGPALELPCGAAGGSRAVLNTFWEQWITLVLAARHALAGVHVA